MADDEGHEAWVGPVQYEQPWYLCLAKMNSLQVLLRQEASQLEPWAPARSLPVQDLVCLRIRSSRRTSICNLAVMIVRVLIDTQRSHDFEFARDNPN